ncbi:MAG: hypothetical protein L0387_42395 [Acidobacteria bacterium]|nr:hypothetical protein [Acidobacteriota bacterium]
MCSVRYGLALLLTLGVVAWGQSLASLTLIPFSSGGKARAAWRANVGLPDSKGNTNFAMEFEKDVATSEPGNGRAGFYGAEGLPASFLTSGTGLAWERRNDGHCGYRSPRWYFSIRGASGAIYNVYLSCAYAVHTPGSAAGWTKDTFHAANIEATIASRLGSSSVDALNGRLLYFYIMFDTGPAWVYLDNIQVNQKVWTGPLDNGT